MNAVSHCNRPRASNSAMNARQISRIAVPQWPPLDRQSGGHRRNPLGAENGRAVVRPAGGVSESLDVLVYMVVTFVVPPVIRTNSIRLTFLDDLLLPAWHLTILRGA